MNAITRLKTRIKTTPLAIPYIAAVSALGRKPVSQSDEATVLTELIATLGGVPTVFIEFGFGGWEFNCTHQAQDRSWRGLLLDGDPYNITIAKTIYHRGIEARKLWITLETLQHVIDYAQGRQIGVLSVDVDGNDYWFLQRLISIRPAIICAEINTFFGLRPITVPYDPEFDRLKKHESRWYFGASLTAVHHLCRKNGYSLVAMSHNGVNTFFVRDDLLVPGLKVLSPEEARRDQIEPDGTILLAHEEWKLIQHLPYVDVTQLA